MSGSDPLASILDWFLEIEQWLPGAHSWVGEIIYGEIPLSDATAVYDLADAWGVLAEQLNDAYEEVLHAADDVLDAWGGDGGAEVFREQWYAYLQALNATAQGAAQMQQGVQEFGMQVELMKFMTALNLLLLAYTLLALIMAALYSFGISLGGAVPAFMAFQTAVSSAAGKVLGAIANIGIRIGIRPLTWTVGRVVPAAVRTSIAAGARAALPAVVSRTVPQVVRTGVAGLAQRAATRGISRSVSSRLASQALRGAASRRLRAELARQVGGRAAAAGARQLGARSTLAVQSALAREIQAQMVARAAGRTVVHTTESLAIRQMAASQVARLSLGRELAQYVGIRVGFGAGFLGGGNLLGQLGQMAEGNRASLDMGQVAQGAITGAAFATGMWGGVLGHTAGGAVAGGLVGAAYEGVQYLTSDDPRVKAFDWNAVGHHAVQGAIMGVVAGADVQVSTMRFSGGMRIGDNVHALPSSSGGLNVVAAAGDGRVIALGDAGVAYQHPTADGGVQRVLSEGMAREPGVGEVFRALMPDGGGVPPSGPPPATPARPVDAPVPARPQLPAADIPVRDAVTGRPSDGGGGGGGPRQPVAQAPHGPAGTRVPERIPAAELPAPVTERPAAVTDGNGRPVRTTPDPVPDGSASRPPTDPPGGPPPPADPPRDGPPPPVEPPRDGSAPPPTVDPVPPTDGAVGPARDGSVPYRLVPVDPVPVGPTAPRADAVAAVVDGHVTGLLEGRPPQTTPVDQPHRATWHPESGTLTVRFGDGLTVDVVLQVNSALPPGHPAVVTPPLSQVDGVFRQTEPAGVVVPAHAPADPVARADLVQRELGNAWSTLHNELRGLPDLRPPGDGPPPQDGTLAALEEGGPGVPVLGPERVTFLDTTPAVPPEPRPLTPEAVQRMLADPTLAEPVAGWVRDNLAVRAADGTYLPRPADEIAAAIAQLQAEAARAVSGPEPATPRDALPGGPEQISQELAAAPPETFAHGRNRTGAELPEQVHELVAKAKAHLLETYPEHVVAERVHDLDRVAAQADRVQALAERAQRTGDVRDLVQGVRDLSQAVNEYSDKYAGWRDFSKGGERADPGWRDLHGVDPLESVEMATRVVSIDPSTNRFHVMDQAIAIAKIGDVLGPVFEQHALHTFERVVPKDMDSVRALLPDDLARSLEPWVNDAGAKGGYRADVGVTFVSAEHGGQPRPISAVAATVVHEGLHALQPHSRMIFDAVQDGLNQGSLSRADADSILANLRFEREYDAFAVQQEFLRGLTGSNSPGFHSDPRIPNSDGYRGLADWSPGQLREHVFQKYLTPSERQLVGADVLSRHPELTPQNAVTRAETAIANANHPIPSERQQGTFHGPVTSRMAEQHGLDLGDIQRRQADQSVPDLARQSDVDNWGGIEAERGPESESTPPMSMAGFTDGRPPGGPDHVPQAPSTRPTATLHIVAFDAGPGGPGHAGLMERVSAALGGVGDHVLLRQPDVPSTDLAPGVRVAGAEPIPGITGRISPLLRLDGLPADANVIVGYRETAGIADVRRDAFPEAKIVQIVDAVPTDPAHIEVIARADLVVAVGPEVARDLAAMLDGLGRERTPPVHELPPLDGEGGARGLHDAIAGLGDGVARVDPAAWQRDLSPREVVLRRAGEAEVPTGDRLRVMTVTTEYWSNRGGIPTANRELTEAFGAAGAEVYARVSTVDFANPEVTRAEPAPGVHVVGVERVWGVLDAKGQPDTRAMSMLPENLPPHVDVVVGNSRFGGGAARWLVEHVYPDATYVHVLHTSPEVLDALRGNPAEGLQHAQTERTLMRDADMVAGVGPLLGQEAARLSAEAAQVAPPVHQIISDMPATPGDPPARPPDRTGFEILVQGRAGDPIKGVDFAAELIADLRADGVDVRLTVRGAPDSAAAAAQSRLLSEIAGSEVAVKPFTTNKAELLGDLYHADLVMMPSMHEGFGLVASEAARAGVPVVVGEGTGAGLFFGDPRHVPAGLGEPATVRDGVTVQMLRDALAAVTAPDGTLTPEAVRSALEQVGQQRLSAWAAHVKEVLDTLDAHRQRALDLREYLDQQFPPGNAARRLLEAMHGGDTGGSPTPQAPVAPSSGPASTHTVNPDLVRSALMPDSRPSDQVETGKDEGAQLPPASSSDV